MAIAELASSISDLGRQAVDTCAGSEVSDSLHRETASQERMAKENWERIIDHRLIEWAVRHEDLEDDELIAPSRQRIQQAIEFATRLRNVKYPAPTRIVPDGHGGIVFEYRRNGDSQAFRISANGSMELVAFKDGSLILRRQLK